MSIRNTLLFCLLFCFNQSKAQHTLTIHIKNCYKETSDTTLRFIRLYQRDTSGLKDLGLFYPNGAECLSIPDLTEGHYYFSYPNRYDKEVSFNLIIEANTDTTELTICPDRHNHGEPNHLPIIMQLRNGESYTINFSSYGCFNSWEDSIKLERMDDKYYISHTKDKVELTIKEYESLQKFEMNLNHFERGGGCTTVDTYEITFKDRTYKYIDDSCEWGGSSELWKQLKLHKK